jgi:hypothetical protein
VGAPPLGVSGWRGELALAGIVRADLAAATAQCHTAKCLQSGEDSAAQRPIVSAAWAVAAMALFLLWQFLTIHYNRGGNWTALFQIGSNIPAPPELARGAYRFPGNGYDGEFYRYVAHDPFMQRGYASYIDAPPLRYQRLLIPVLAFLLAAGRQPWIDRAYIAAIVLFVFLGAYWLSRWAVPSGAHPAWALAFLLVPATLISMDRMTVDVAMAAFTLAFAVYWRSGEEWKLFAVLLLACLVRETGLLLVAGICLFQLSNRRFGRALRWAFAALPMFIWYAFIRAKFGEKAHFGMPLWLADGFSLFARLFRPPRYPLPPLEEAIARSADVLALAAILLAAILAIVIFLRANPRAHPRGPLAFSGLLFAALVFAFSGDEYWIDVNAYARLLSPLLILTVLPAIAGQAGPRIPLWLSLLPAMAVDLRLGIEFTSAIGGVLRGLFGR